MDQAQDTYDYIIVGAGTAGCVLANRLTASGKHRVLLIEAGGDDRIFADLKRAALNTLIHLPVGFARTLYAPQLNWGYKSEPIPGVGGRVIDMTRGRVLGGSSSINGMLHVRGARGDYDGWRDAGCAGWGWDDVLPYFRKSEAHFSAGDTWHGADGPVRVSENVAFPVMEKALDAATRLGLPRAETLDDGAQFGGGKASVAIHGGRRQSSSVVYLHPILRRPNLTVITDGQVTRLVFDGKHARGVELLRAGAKSQAHANAEVLLAAGAIGSPHLLQLSGVGHAEKLNALGIPVVAHSPGVGDNLQDHYFARCAWRLQPGIASINDLVRFPRILGEIAKYVFSRKGLLATSASQLLVYARSSPEMLDPDIQFSIAPASTRPTKPGTQSIEPDTEPGMTIASCQLRPTSRGYVRARSPDPLAHPAIQPNYLDSAFDQEVQIKAMQLARRIVAQEPLAECIAQENAPSDQIQTDTELLSYIRATGSTVFHPVGTVRMGPDANDPLDASLRVRGVDGLRVIDASIMPTIVSGNTNAPTLMIAEKASDLILQH